MEPGALTRDYLWDHRVEDGVVRVGFAGAVPPVGSGPLGQIVFQRAGRAAAGAEELVLVRVQINEEEVRLEERPAIVTDGEPLPLGVSLYPNCPNPFNPQTAIGYDLPRDSQVRLSVYNLLGQQVRVLVEERQAGGHHQALWDGRDQAGRSAATGVYLYRLETESGTRVRRMLMVK